MNGRYVSSGHTLNGRSKVLSSDETTTILTSYFKDISKLGAGVSVLLPKEDGADYQTIYVKSVSSYSDIIVIFQQLQK